MIRLLVGYLIVGLLAALLWAAAFGSQDTGDDE